MRRGRKRKVNVERYRSGRVRQVPAVSPATIAARMPHRGSIPQKDVLSQMAESELGRTCLHGHVSKGEYLAGLEFARVVAKYRATIAAPKAIFTGGRGFDCGGVLGCEDCECLRRKTAYDRAYDALAKAGHGAAVAVRKVVIQDEPCPWALRRDLVWGLAALREHFGIVEGRR